MLLTAITYFSFIATKKTRSMMFDVGTIKLFEQLNLFGQLNKDSMFFQKKQKA